jgi:acetyl-CoA synthetase
MHWLVFRLGDFHWNIISPGCAKLAWSCFFAPLNSGATVFAYNYGRFHARDVLGMISRKGVTSLCAPPTVWRMLVQEKLSDYRVSLREAASGEPPNPEVIEQVRGLGLTVVPILRPTESTAMIGTGQPVKLGRWVGCCRATAYDWRKTVRSAWTWRRVRLV